MYPELALPLGIDRPTRDAAATAMRHARARLNASTDDLRTVHAALFAEVQS